MQVLFVLYHKMDATGTVRKILVSFYCIL